MEKGLSSTTSPTCGICFTLASLYVCPRCGINYCSLTCYRNKKHAACSENFYKECCLGELKHKKASDYDKRKMYEILRRESDQALQSNTNSDHESEESSSDGNTEDYQDDGLTSIFRGIDLNSETFDSNAVWSQLTIQERREFWRQLRSGAIADFFPVWSPWWIQPEIAELNASCEEVVQPQLCNVPPLQPLSALLGSKTPHISVIYAISEVLLGYVFIARYYNGDHLEMLDETCDFLLQLTPTLNSYNVGAKRKSSEAKHKHQITKSTCYSNFGHVVLGMQSRLASKQYTCDAETMLLLVEDVGYIIAAHSEAIQRVLVETQAMLIAASNRHTKHQTIPAVRKLTFFRAAVGRLDEASIEWSQDSTRKLQHEVKMEVLFRQADVSAHCLPKKVSAAGPNWRQMIRESPAAQAAHFTSGQLIMPHDK